MEVLSAPLPAGMPTPPAPFSGNISPKPSRSLLDRRSTAKRLLGGDQNTANATIPLGQPVTTLLNAVPTFTLTPATSSSSSSSSSGSPSSTALRSSRTGQPTVLPFVPLTPIIASPRLTPDIGTAAGAVMVSNTSDGGTSRAIDSSKVSNHKVQGSNPDQRVFAGSKADYLNRGRPATAHSCTQNDTNVAGPSSLALAESTLPPPSWTSTPPTPPPFKGSFPSPPSRLAVSMNADGIRRFASDSPGSPSRNRLTSRSRSGSRPRHTRPASVSVFPAHRPPSPPMLTIHITRSDTTHESATSPSSPSSSTRPQPHAVSTSPDSASSNSYMLSSPASIVSIPFHPPRFSSQTVLPSSARTSLDDNPQSFHTLPSTSSSAAPAQVKRRNTLPPYLLSPAATVAHGEAFSRSDEAVYMTHKYGHSLDSAVERGADGVLLPSLSRTGRPRAVRPRNASSSSLNMARKESTSSSRGRKMFIVGDGDASDADNDSAIRTEEQLPCDAENGGAEHATPEAPADEAEHYVPETEEDRKRTRRYHALLELVATEVGYLMDLRALVSIYLAQLPLLDVPAPLSLSRTAPSSLSIPNLGLSRPFPSSRSSFLHPPTCALVSEPLLPVPPVDRPREAFERERDLEKEKEKEKERDKISRRPLFSEQEVQMVMRNASDLLALHENFVELLQAVMEPFGLGSAFTQLPSEGKKHTSRDDCEANARQSVDEVVAAVADLLSREAVSFEIYEAFCPGHNEATDLIRSVQEQHPVEWDAFEQRCSLRVAHAFEQAGSSSSSTDSTHRTDSLRSKRRHSMPSVAMPIALSPLGASFPIPMPLAVVGHAKSDPSSGHKRKGSGDITNGMSSQAGRLKFLDYLIKPVQRICKYPLLLDQLKVKRALSLTPAEVADRVDAAASAMRDVVVMVDHASERRAHHVKSSLIASRLMSNCPASPTSPITPEDRPAQLSPEFMQSLGACLLAGALDVVYYQSNGSARSKYLAAFLYMGGYLILAKVPKSGKWYEPKHWFSLAGFEIIDQDDDEALPYAFHLWSASQHLHLAAACQLEKTIWTSAIQEALSVDSPAWTNVPAACIPTNSRPVVLSEEIGTEWATTPLPTIQSMSELETPAETGGPTLPSASPRKIAKTMSRVDSIVLRQEFPMTSLNRRTSTSSVKAFFSPLSFDSRVTRPSSQIRQQVDHGLHDVVTDSFVAVRSQAQMRDEELFQIRKKSGNVSRSNSGLSISGAFTSRRRQDSIILSRRKGSVDGIVDLNAEPEAVSKAANPILSRRSKSSGGKLRSKNRLSLLPAQTLSRVDTDTDGALLSNTDGCLESPSPMTQCSSATSSNPNSVLPSPLELTMPLPTPPNSLLNRSPDTRRTDTRPKRARSMVDNVKHFFNSRSISPTPSFQRSPKAVICGLDPEHDTQGGLKHWWRRGSLRRRAQSSPDAPTDESTPVTPAASSDDSNHSDLKPISERRLLMPTLPSRGPRKVSFSGAPPPILHRRSLFSSATRPDLQSPVSAEPAPSLSRSKTLKNILLFQRSSSTPEDVC